MDQAESGGNTGEVRRKTVWVAPDGFEHEKREEVLRHTAQTVFTPIVDEYMRTVEPDLAGLKPRAKNAQLSMARSRVHDFLFWAQARGMVFPTDS